MVQQRQLIFKPLKRIQTDKKSNVRSAAKQVGEIVIYSIFKLL